MGARARREAGWPLAAAGVVLLVLGAFALPDDTLAPSPSRGTQQLWSGVLLGLAAVWFLVRRVIDRAAADGRGSPVLVSLADLARWLLAAVIVLAAVVTALGVDAAVIQFGAGYPGRNTVLVAAGGAGMLVGALLWWMPRRTDEAAPRRPAAWTGLPAGALVAAAVPIAALDGDWTLHTTTAAGPTRTAAVPDAVSAVAWSAPRPGRILDAVAGSDGPVLNLGDRIVGLDGNSGRVRWSYRRDGVDTNRLLASPDGHYVVFQLETSVYRTPAHKRTTVVLDARTGARVWTADVDYTDATSAGLIVEDDEARTFTSYAWTDRHVQWRYRVPYQCRVGRNPLDSGSWIVAAGVLLDPECGERTTRSSDHSLVLLDARTGKPRWRHDAPSRDQRTRDVEQDDLRVTEDGTYVVATYLVARAPARYVTYVVDTASGQLYRPDVGQGARPFDRLLAHGFGTDATATKGVVDLRTGRTVMSAQLTGQCAPYSLVALARGVVCTAKNMDETKVLHAGHAIELLTGSYAGPLRLVSVDLGGPYRDDDPLGSLKSHLAEAPGGVLVGSAASLPSGARGRIVALR